MSLPEETMINVNRPADRAAVASTADKAADLSFTLTPGTKAACLIGGSMVTGCSGGRAAGKTPAQRARGVPDRTVNRGELRSLTDMRTGSLTWNCAGRVRGHEKVAQAHFP